MPGYLLDTNVLIDWLRNVESVIEVLDSLAAEENQLAVCCLGVAELYAGLREPKREPARAVIDALEYWDIDPRAAALAGLFRYRYARQGIQLSTPDMLHGALAVSRDATLVTGNVKDFPMPELKLLPVPAR